MKLSDQASNRPAEEVLSFWLGTGPYDGDWASARQSTWFAGDAATDRAIEQGFGELPDAASHGRLDGWLAHPVDWLAWLIVVDQFPRNLYRDSPRAFAMDARAQQVAEEGLQRGFDEELPLATRLFCYLPFEHAEELALQERSLTCFARLHAASDDGLKEATANWLAYARRHAEPVRRFGRFPHRNDVLGRNSTPAEREWLREHPEGF